MSFDSGVSLDWTNERTQRFLQEHLNALREVAASGESDHASVGWAIADAPESIARSGVRHIKMSTVITLG
jgi:hypothetical protein